MEYRLANKQDIPALKALFSATFGDSEADLDAFFAEIFPEASCFAAFEDGNLAAMAYALPQLCVPSQERAAYLYAVATAPRYRGQGVCRKLLAFAEEALKKEGVSCLLLACETEELAQMYRKMGFSGAPLAYEAPNLGIRMQKIDAQTYGGLRETILLDSEHVRYTPAQLRLTSRGAEFYALAGFGCASIRTLSNGKRQVLEWLEPGKEAKAAPFMIKKLEDGAQTPYCAFAFD